MSIGTAAVLISVLAALGIGLLWRARDGRIRVRKTTARAESEYSVVEGLPEELRQRLVPEDGTNVTLLQLSTTFCAPCRHTRILLDNFAQRTDGVRHVEVDLTHHPEWSTPLHVHRTPTTLALDNSGRELFRVGGVPRQDELAAALRPHLKTPDHPTS
jgi:thiol-disulfide isomerase/thioredoxin